MPDELAQSIVNSGLRGEDDIRNSSCCRAVWLLEHGMKVVVRVLEERFLLRQHENVCNIHRNNYNIRLHFVHLTELFFLECFYSSV